MQQKGQIAEENALIYLQNKGLRLLTKNYSCRLGEIDLIMWDNDYLVFIEVRMRTNAHFGGGIGSITYAKRQKIIKTTAYYLLKHQLQNQHAVRFDVIGIDGTSGAITWIKDAFGVDY